MSHAGAKSGDLVEFCTYGERQTQTDKTVREIDTCTDTHTHTHTHTHSLTHSQTAMHTYMHTYIMIRIHEYRAWSLQVC